MNARPQESEAEPVMPAPGESVATWRLAYAEIGWHTFLVHGIQADGCCTCGKPECKAPGKHPVFPGKNRGATIDPVQIRREGMKHPGANIGVHLGLSRLVCIDVDPRNGGNETLARLERQHGGLDTTVIADTGGGGRHLFFAAPGEGTPLPSKGSVGSGIDVLHGTSYPVIAPSRHASGKAYRWAERCDPWEGAWLLCFLPFWIMEGGTRDGVNGPEVTSDDNGWMEHLPARAPFGWTEENVARLIEALGYIPAERRDRWLRVGAAIHQASDGRPKGKELFDEWSEGSDRFGGCVSKYDQAVQDSTWDGFDAERPGGVTVASIFYEAKRYGWTPRHTADEIDAMLDVGNADPEPQEDRYPLYTPAECASAPLRGYVIKGFIAPGDLACIYGPPGAGKSLLTPHAGYRVALGLTVFGQRTRQGKVLYVAAEDLHGMRGRITALRMEHGDTSDFLLMGGVSDLLTEGGPDLAALLDVIEKHRPDLVIVDTLAMAFPGLKENEADEMGRIVAVARKLSVHGAAVVLIHHDTKARDGTPRGHSVLNGALDVAVCLDPAKEDGIVRGHLTKNRNGPQTLKVAFRIETRDAGMDEDGDPIRLPVAVEVTSHIDARTKLTPSEQAALDELLEMIQLSNDSVLIAQWQAQCELTRVVSIADKRASRTKAFARALKRLEKKGLIRTNASHAWPTSMPERAPDFEPFEFEEEFEGEMDTADAL